MSISPVLVSPIIRNKIGASVTVFWRILEKEADGVSISESRRRIRRVERSSEAQSEENSFVAGLPPAILRLIGSYTIENTTNHTAVKPIRKFFLFLELSFST